MVCIATKGRGEIPEMYDAPSKGETWRQAKRDILEEKGVCTELQVQGTGKVTRLGTGLPSMNPGLQIPRMHIKAGHKSGLLQYQFCRH